MLEFVPRIGIHKRPQTGKTTIVGETQCFSGHQRRRCKKMTNRNTNSINVPEAREAMDKFKMEAASDVGVPKQ